MNLQLALQSECVALGIGKRKEVWACGTGREMGIDGSVGVSEWMMWVVGFLMGLEPLTVFWAEGGSTAGPIVASRSG